MHQLLGPRGRQYPRAFGDGGEALAETMEPELENPGLGDGTGKMMRVLDAARRTRIAPRVAGDGLVFECPRLQYEDGWNPPITAAAGIPP